MTLYGIAVLVVVFGSIMAALDLLLFAFTPAILTALARQAPRRRADAILAFRSIPLAGAFALAAFVSVPAWLLHEPRNLGESLSPTLLALALLAALPILQGARCGLRIFLRTRDHLLFWRRRGRKLGGALAPFEVLEVESADLALCVGGYLTPTIYASTEVMTNLDPEELEAAFAHEISHAKTRDPLRLLWMGSCPDFLQLLRLDGVWRRAFSSACEFAADERASRGDRAIALDLASALVKVARLGTSEARGAGVMADLAVSSAYASRSDLEARIIALANPSGPALPEGFAVRPWMLASVVVVLCGVGFLGSEQVHAVTEAVGRTLAP